MLVIITFKNLSLYFLKLRYNGLKVVSSIAHLYLLMPIIADMTVYNQYKISTFVDIYKRERNKKVYNQYKISTFVDYSCSYFLN